MKKGGVLNAPLSRIIAAMGHTNKLVICDSGLPIPRKAEVVDLALTKNIPRFIDALRVILDELQVEQAIVAEELVKSGNGLYEEIISLLPGVKILKVSHDEFKYISSEDSETAFVRTGEATPYANIILVSGVTF
ncbi:MAG: D-ribose pyranase [Melioribacteraceae bacterium]|nr:MAG: D-ribose pyranase [Melioribacteraceae bacterium]